MASRFSPNAKEFIPASAAEYFFQAPSLARFGDAGVRPKTQQKQTHHANFQITEGESIGQWNVAAPEFKPLASTQLNNSAFHGINNPEKTYGEKNRGPELLNQNSRTRSSNWRDKANSNQGIESQPSAHDPKKRVGLSQPKLDKQDVKQKTHSGGLGKESQRKHGGVKREDGRSQNFEPSTGASGRRKDTLSSRELCPQSNMSRKTRNLNDMELSQLGRGPTGTHRSVRNPNEGRGVNMVFESEAYPRLGGSTRPLNSDQSVFSGKSWSKVLQSNPSQKNIASSANNNNGRQREDKQEKNERKIVANSDEQPVPGKGNGQSWENSGSNQIFVGSKSGKPETKGWPSRNSHFSHTNSSTWSKKPTFNVDRKQREYKPYQGDLEWRVDADNARRQAAMSEGHRTRIYSNMRAIRNVGNWKKTSTTMTKYYRFRNVTDEFRNRVERILFSGSVTNEAKVIDLSRMNSWRKDRGWYDFCEWNTCTQNQGIDRNTQGSNCEGLNPKSFSIVDGQEDPKYCQQKPLEQQSDYEGIPYPTAAVSAWSILSDSSQVSMDYTNVQSNSTRIVSDLIQERSDVSIDRSPVALLESNDNSRNGTEQEKSRESLTDVSDNEIECQDVVDGDVIDDENEWVCVEAKSTIRARKKERIIASQQQSDLGWEDVPDRNESEPLSIDKIMKGNGRTAGNEMKANPRRSGKSKQGEAVAEKKEKAKKKRKKKKAKEKGKPLYDNDQQKIREFKMREMIEENLKMNLVELTRTRQSTGTKIEKEEVEDWPAIGDKATHSAKLMSFSDALKRSKPVPERPLFSVETSQSRGIIEVDISKLTEEEKMELRRKKLKEKVKQKKKEKKKRKKAEKIEQNEQDSQKKPLTFDLGTMFDKLLQSSAEETSRKSSKKPTKTVLFSSGVISVASGVAKKNNPDGSRAKSTKGKPSGNFLDSTQPLKMSGKERETPRKPKRTLLKKIILRAREAKLKAREAQTSNPISKNKDEDLSKESEKACETETNDQENKASSSTDAGSDDASLLAEERLANNETEDKQDEQGADVDHLCEPLTELPKEVISKLHTRKFREYCDHFVSKDINSIVYKILKGLQRFQTRAYLENPIKAKAKRRLVLGIREVAKHAKMGKLQCAIIAPNLEKINVHGGIDFYLSKIIFNCKQFNIPIIYAMNRQVLGFVLNRKVPVSAIGIFNYSGVEDDFKNLCVLVEEQREKYKERVEQVMLQQSQLGSSTFQSSLRRGRINRGEHMPNEFFINPDAPVFIPGRFSA